MLRNIQHINCMYILCLTALMLWGDVVASGLKRLMRNQQQYKSQLVMQ